MDIKLILYIIILIAGILINIFIKKLVMLIFKKDGTFPRVPIRFIGIYLIIKAISNIFHI